MLHVTSGCAAAVQPGEERVFYTYLQVRDDDLVLFAFNLKEEKELFLQLLSVSGIGPKAALSILSTLTVKQIKLGIINEDVALLTQVPGIGPKSAKRIILELKEKLKDLVLETDGENAEELAAIPRACLNEHWILCWLWVFQEASSALHKVNRNKTSSTEDQVKEALRLLANR